MSRPALSGPIVGIGAAPLSIAGQASALATRISSRRVAPSGICFAGFLFIVDVLYHLTLSAVFRMRVATDVRHFTELQVREGPVTNRLLVKRCRFPNSFRLSRSGCGPLIAVACFVIQLWPNSGVLRH